MILGPKASAGSTQSPPPVKPRPVPRLRGRAKTYKHTDMNRPLAVQRDHWKPLADKRSNLASDCGACTTGRIIRVDGGFHVLGMPQADNVSTLQIRYWRSGALPQSSISGALSRDPGFFAHLEMVRVF